MLKSPSRAVSAVAILAAPLSVGLLALALSACTHSETTTSSSTTSAPAAASNSIIGTWKIQGTMPRPAQHISAMSGFVFEPNERCFMKYVMLSPERRYKETSEPCTWSDLGNGHIRVIQNGSATEFKDDVSATQLVLTGEGALAGGGYAFDRVTK